MRSQQFTMRGTRREEYLSYFEKIGEGREEIPGSTSRVTGKGWMVLVGPESEIQMGSIRFPEVPITINCEDDLFDAFIRDYRLKFMTAGG